MAALQHEKVPSIMFVSVNSWTIRQAETETETVKEKVMYDYVGSRKKMTYGLRELSDLRVSAIYV